MSVTRGRVVKADALGGVPVRAPGAPAIPGPVIWRREGAGDPLRGELRKEAMVQRHARLAALDLALRARAAEIREREVRELVGLAVLLAERLVGEALPLAPERIATLARHALDDARGAREATIFAHPDDAAALARVFSSLGVTEGAARIATDPALARGDLRVETDVGTVHAEIRPQLERLAGALLDALGKNDA